MISIFRSNYEPAAQRFAIPAGGRAWTMFGSKENSKPEKCLKIAQTPQR